MTLLDKLQAHKGGLIQLKTQLYWYGGRGYDNNPGRICLILDAAAHLTTPNTAAATTAADAVLHVTPRSDAPIAHAAARRAIADALLLIDGTPQWIWVAEEDIELLVNDPPTN
jgi:hypothetical protein